MCKTFFLRNVWVVFNAHRHGALPRVGFTAPTLSHHSGGLPRVFSGTSATHPMGAATHGKELSQIVTRMTKAGGMGRLLTMKHHTAGQTSFCLVLLGTTVTGQDRRLFTKFLATCPVGVDQRSSLPHSCLDSMVE